MRRSREVGPAAVTQHGGWIFVASGHGVQQPPPLAGPRRDRSSPPLFAGCAWTPGHGARGSPGTLHLLHFVLLSVSVDIGLPPRHRHGFGSHGEKVPQPFSCTPGTFAGYQLLAYESWRCLSSHRRPLRLSRTPGAPRQALWMCFTFLLNLPEELS